MSLTSQLPKVRGRYRENVPLADSCWFRVGGAAQVVFKPEDAKDLAFFLKELDSRLRGNDGERMPVTILGAASNVVIRDGGIQGVLVRLGRGFASLERDHECIVTGAANLDVNVAQFALQEGLTGLEFLSGIPGAIGGALRMNAGAYGREMVDVVEKVEAVSPQGEIVTYSNAEMGFSYRHCSLPEGVVFTRAWLRAEAGDKDKILARMQEIQLSRADAQPIRERTGGSTFRNPEGKKAWELIDAAGLRGTMLGGAKVSEKHCNFLINTGTATAADLEQLTQLIIRQVYEHSGVTLIPEIKFLGSAR